MQQTQRQQFYHLCFQKKIMKKRGVNVQTISVYISTTLVLLLLGIMGALFIGAQSLTHSVQKNLILSVIIKNETSEEAILKLKKEIEKDKRILNIAYISKEQALAEESKALKTNPEEILGYNPYEASLEITLEPQYANSTELQAIERNMLKKKEVKEVIYQKELVDTINTNIRKAGIILLTLLAMLTIISWSLIGNMVRLSIYSKRFILHTMKLVGASWSFICRPFIFKNMWIGIFSGIASNIILASILYLLQQNEPEIINIIEFDKLAIVGVIVIVFGMAICMLCALLSVLRFLRMRRNDLYFI